MGPDLSGAEALRARADPPYLVSGYLWKFDDDVLLCTSIVVASPPRCGGPSLRVRGLDVAHFTGLRTEGATMRSEHPVQLLGVVTDGVITIAVNTWG